MFFLSRNPIIVQEYRRNAGETKNKIFRKEIGQVQKPGKQSGQRNVSTQKFNYIFWWWIFFSITGI